MINTIHKWQPNCPQAGTGLLPYGINIVQKQTICVYNYNPDHSSSFEWALSGKVGKEKGDSHERILRCKINEKVIIADLLSRQFKRIY